MSVGSTLAVMPEPAVNAPVSAGAKDAIAGIRLTDEGTVFSWLAPQSDPKLTSQMMNCLLEISDGKQTRVAQLREPLRLAPITLDLTLDKQRVETQLVGAPRGNTLYLEVTELRGFSREVTLRGGRNSIAANALAAQMPAFAGLPSVGAQVPGMPTSGFAPQAGMGLAPGVGVAPGMVPGTGIGPLAPPPRTDVLVIEFAENPALEILIGLTESNGKLAITVDPTYRDEGKSVALTIDKIGEIEEDAKKDLASAQRDLDESQPKLRHWAGKLKGIEGNKPAPTSARYAAWMGNYNDAKGNVNRYQRAVDGVTERVDKAKARIDSALKLYKLLQESDKQATIHFVVYSECGDTDLLLVDGRGQQ